MELNELGMCVVAWWWFLHMFFDLYIYIYMLPVLFHFVTSHPILSS